MSPVVTRLCTVCDQRVQPQRHCHDSKYCDWWTCPLCRSEHCHGRSIDRRKGAKK